MTVGEIVREVAAKYGFSNISDEMIEYVTWEETGYPSFWPDTSISPEENFRKQVAEFFASRKPSEGDK